MNNLDKKNKSFVILSAELNGLSAKENLYRSSELEQTLIDLKVTYKEIEEVYKGLIETSFYVERTKHLFDIIKLAKEYGQESILIVNENRRASLGYLTSPALPTCDEIDCNFHHYTDIGKFTQVSEQEAVSQDNYTYDFNNDGYYICK